MKRIKAACLEQTVHFQLKDDLGHAAAARAVKEEYEHYKMQLERSRTRYKIVGDRSTRRFHPHQDQKAIQPPRLRRLYGLSHSPPHPL